MFRWLKRKPKLRQVEHILLRPTDSLLVVCEDRISAEEAERINWIVRRFQAGELPALVLPSNYRVAVVTRCEDAT